MDIGELAAAYGGLPARVVARAREILRLATAKRSIAIEMTTPIACVVVACRSMDEPIDVKKLCGLLGVSARNVDQVARKIFNAVNIKSIHKITPSSLCVRHGCAAITELVNRVYHDYQGVVHQLSRGSGGGGGGVQLFDPNNPVFAAACLYASARRAKLRIDRLKLLADICANPRTFDSVVNSVETHCEAALAGAPAATSRIARSATPPASDGPVKAPLTMTKAAQRAALVLEKAVAKQDAAEKASKVQQTAAKATVATATAETSVTPEEYQAWRQKVLLLRRQVDATAQSTPDKGRGDAA